MKADAALDLLADEIVRVRQALDVTAAGIMLQGMLWSWNEWYLVKADHRLCITEEEARRLMEERRSRVILPARHFREVPADPKPDPQSTADIMTRYQWNLLQGEWSQAGVTPPEVGRLHIKDPVPLAFHPHAAFARERAQAKRDDRVSLRRIWKDPLARTLWLGVKPFYLTDQNFRWLVLAQARQLRHKPPRTYEDYSLSVTNFWASSVHASIREQLHPYIVRCLINEKRWPYFVPGRIPARPLGWVYVPPGDENTRRTAAAGRVFRW
jgi:hypothetical protein